MGWLLLWWALRRERRRRRRELWAEPSIDFGGAVLIWGMAIVLAAVGVLVSLWLWLIAVLVLCASVPFWFSDLDE